MSDLILRGEADFELVLQDVSREPGATALFCDIDGTISPIAPTPAQAEVPEHVRTRLAALTSRLGLVAFVTGRTARDGARLVGLKNAIYIGTHGFETMDSSGTIRALPAAEPFVPEVQAIAAQATQADLEPLGIVLENKRTVLAVHYRLAPDVEAARQAILAAVIRPARQRGLLLTSGKFVVEVRPPLEVSKGSAARELLDSPTQRHAGPYRTALFFGDDRTDVTGFAAVRAWARAQPQSRSHCALAAISDETPPEVKDAADVWVAGVDGVAEALRRLLAATASVGRLS